MLDSSRPAREGGRTSEGAEVGFNQWGETLEVLAGGVSGWL